MIVFLLMAAPSQVSAVEYIFEEDFTGIDTTSLDWIIENGFPDWTLQGIEFAEFADNLGRVPLLMKIEKTASYLQISNGKLYSTRVSDSTARVFDVATHPLRVTTGAWQFTADALGDSDQAWRFILTDNTVDWAGTTIYNMHFHTIQVAVGEESIDVIETQYGKGVELHNRVPYSVDVPDQRNTFDVIREEESVLVYMNSELVVEHTLEMTFLTFDHFGIMTPRSINVDNFKVTTDVEGMISELDLENEASPNIGVLLGGIALFAVIVVLSSMYARGNLRYRRQTA